MEIGTVARNIRGKETGIGLWGPRSCAKDGRWPHGRPQVNSELSCAFIYCTGPLWEIPLVNSSIAALVPIDALLRDPR